MSRLLISGAVMAKLANKSPPVSREEICECFSNRDGPLLLDKREKNKTNPPTHWFVSDTFRGRMLKVVFVPREDGGIAIKTAYDPNEQEVRIYESACRRQQQERISKRRPK